MAERPMVTARPQHDHRFGPCTLPERINAESAPTRRPARGCYWVVTDRFADSVANNGCRECTGYYFRREERRRSRHEARRELRAYRGLGWMR
jgi:hypothetical protein